LRALGVLPPNYKLDSLTKNQKDRIVKLSHRFAPMIKHPEEFKSKIVKGSTAHKLRQAGFTVKRTGKVNRAIFGKHGAKNVVIKNGKIIREYSDHQNITNLFPNKDVFKQAADFFKRKKPGEYLMMRVDDKNTFGVRINNMNDFIKYLENFQRSKPKAYEAIKNHLYIVKVKGASDNAEDEDSEDDSDV